MRVEAQQSIEVQRQRLREAARQMEAHFLHHLLKAMRRTVPSAHTSYAAQMYTDMMDEALAKQLAESDRFGLGKLLYERLSPYLQASESTSGGDGNDERG